MTAELQFRAILVDVPNARMMWMSVQPLDAEYPTYSAYSDDGHWRLSVECRVSDNIWYYKVSKDTEASYRSYYGDYYISAETAMLDAEARYFRLTNNEVSDE